MPKDPYVFGSGDGPGGAPQHLKTSLAYLSGRGISDIEEIKALGFTFHTATDVKLGYFGRAVSPSNDSAIHFQHYDNLGDPIDWSSARMIQPAAAEVRSAWEALTTRKAGAKMLCPRGVPIHSWLCPLREWGSIPKGARVYIHESVVKAAVCSLLSEDIYAVGLNGVNSFGSKGGLTDELMRLPWQTHELVPVIVYDSNCSPVRNPQVWRAAITLGERLVRQCKSQAPMMLELEQPPAAWAEARGVDWGFDDAVAHHGRAWGRELLTTDLVSVNVSDLSLRLAELNELVCSVDDIVAIVRQDTGTVMSGAAFTNLAYSNWIVWEEGQRGAQKAVSVAKRWIQWENRTCVDGMKYIPGRELIGIANDFKFYNLWRGLGIEPVAGDVSLGVELLNNSVVDVSLRKWVIQWLAYPLQRCMAGLEGRVATSLVLVGPQGVGKGRLAWLMQQLYGTNGILVDMDDMTSSFNAHVAAKQFIVIDEMTAGGPRSWDKTGLANKLKKLITAEEIVVNEKGVKKFNISAHANYMVTTNYLDAIKLDQDDRRFAVVTFDGVVDRRDDAAYWNTWSRWAESGEGQAAWLDYLLGVDLTGFDPKGWAPETAAKAVMKQASLSAMEEWVLGLPETMDVDVGGRVLFTANDLAVIFMGGVGDSPRAGDVQRLSRVLRMYGYDKAYAGKLIKVAGRPERYWVVDKGDRRDWQNLDICRGHLEGYLAVTGAKM